jgi:2-dehydro-3-deoxyphosphogluconate aldolase/(4S)-4-hydroxy-2-oxoglutarate aldolase
MKFVPTGGINQENCRNFLVTPEILAVGGSFILSEKRIMKDNGKTADQKLATLIKIRNQNK